MQHRYSMLVAAAAALMTIAGCSADSAVAPGGPDLGTADARIASAPAPDRATSRYEIDFMQDMIAHHAMAIMMADMCLEKNLVHEELSQLCADIKATQTAEMQQMQGWLQEWYGLPYEPEMKPGMMNQTQMLAELDGAEFEIEFMEMMIQHHKKAVKEGEQCLKRAYHPELRELCADIVETQTAEMELMQAWLCEWYDRCKK